MNAIRGLTERTVADQTRWMRWALSAMIVAFLYALPWIRIPFIETTGTDFTTVLFFPVGIYVLCAVGLDLSVGRAGIVNFGYAGFVAIGAYAMAKLTVSYGWTYWGTLPLAAALGGVGALVLGLATLRLAGDYLAIVTLAFGLIVETVITNTTALGGPQGIPGIPAPPSILGLAFETFDVAHFWLLILTLILVAIFAVRRLVQGRVGRAWGAIREDEEAAQLMGVPLFRFKAWSLVIGGVIGGVAGATYGAQAAFVSSDTFSVMLSILLLSAVILGGAGNLPGVILGAVLIAYLPERVRAFQDLRVLIFSALLVVMMIARPQGILPRRRRQRTAPPVSRAHTSQAATPVSLRTSQEGAGAQEFEGARLLEFDSVTVRFGGVIALDDVSFVVKPGEILGLIGPNGAGKTTVFNTITGIYPPETGRITMKGVSIVDERPDKIARAGIARTFQNIRVFGSMTAKENVLVGTDAHHETGIAGTLLHGPRFHREELGGWGEAAELLGFVGLAEFSEAAADDLSGGNQRRLEIARALATGCDLLLLDEPAAGFDQQEKRALLELVERIRASGRTILLIDHDMALITGICDRIVVLDFGRKIADGTPSEITASARVIEAYLGVDHAA